MLVMENQGHSRNDEHVARPMHDLQDFILQGCIIGLTGTMLGYCFGPGLAGCSSATAS